jgi:hypothetical protein
LAAPAQGQAPGRDSVTGTIEEPFLPTLLVTWTFDASSGPQGENQTGTVFNQFLGTGPVSCLSVEGNRAVIGTFFESVGSSWLVYVVDGGIVDTIEYESFDSPPIAVCPPCREWARRPRGQRESHCRRRSTTTASNLEGGLQERWLA